MYTYHAETLLARILVAVYHQLVPMFYHLIPPHARSWGRAHAKRQLEKVCNFMFGSSELNLIMKSESQSVGW